MAPGQPSSQPSGSSPLSTGMADALKKSGIAPDTADEASPENRAPRNTAPANQDGAARPGEVSALGDVPTATKGDLSDGGVLSSVIQIVEDATGIESDEIRARSSLDDDLNVDSLTKIEIAVQLEDKYGIRVEEPDVKSAGTVDGLVQLVQRKLGH
ncbi:phosphopantetheine-binding protein [Corynebacterium heidelbergense]|uniref:Carrier domain-containing protein n=1 Tax=Corynebacterium heidelbergense TaxID=2055947 RepID=A0A364VBE0_9CORY|nr:phosphopantetheine-binding protein [Corynebacterium heidelbergense]RAV33965.1 hypothetical protein CWC39_05715 [Corynebacterium heidelbergense]WCZ36300.1 Meromycolate extension acyl carrier protein [Corynebacterium heidelbergense]